MTDEEKARLFEIKCRSKRGLHVSLEDSAFCREMYEKYPDEYGEDERRVYEETAPFGSL
jgi:hypothetical protein